MHNYKELKKNVFYFIYKSNKIKNLLIKLNKNLFRIIMKLLLFNYSSSAKILINNRKNNKNYNYFKYYITILILYYIKIVIIRYKNIKKFSKLSYGFFKKKKNYSKLYLYIYYFKNNIIKKIKYISNNKIKY
jgi:hypothetical protein